ncbi:glycine cleavage system protein GcvH [Aquisalimonas sp. 2447]|uniref:glycine cleavage system protein GcvH n=1 Tax=Aquisalimonas sp. 2447 TaxID=2740807 RepID=UPI00143232AE|nr:glycine cleavage system protein GcvH [Aquisalimonas sp. 2447]QIT54011.1 glycine cleavage system protein GcvH [Aquisalimonas sp. 2447]
MSNVPGDLKYASSHEWVRAEDDGTVTVGISDHAQDSLGDLVFVETPEIDRAVEAGEACAVVESVKAASDIYAPVAGTIIDANSELQDSPELVNSDPYGEGWIMRIRIDDPDVLEELMDADAYEHLLAEEDED